jgi:drug/metabolite transporter (DMT)-like permease
LVTNFDNNLMNARVTTQSGSPRVRPLWLADLTLLLVAIIWGVNIPVMKVALHRIDAYAFNAMRLVVSSVVLIFFARREFLNGIRPASTLSKRDVCIYAIVVSMAYQLLFLLAISHATSADVALIMATVPMWTAIGARFFLKEILPRMAWVGLIMAFSGTMIVTLHKVPTPTIDSKVEIGGQVIVETTAHSVSDVEPPPPESPQATTNDGSPGTPASRAVIQQHEREASRRLSGNLFALSAALAWAGGTVFSRPLLGKISPIQLSACSATLGLPFHIIIALVVGWDSVAASAAAMKDAWLVTCTLYSGILSTGLALAMWSYGVKHAGAAQAAMIQNLTPVVAMAAAWVWLGETINSAQALGGGMIIGGLFIMHRSRRSGIGRNT